ncbi:MAG: T9SS type A sorting domain-containing protein, partial [Bacteroidota bacterium]
NLLATGPEFVTPELNQTTTYWVEEYETFQEAPAFGGKTEIGSGGYTYENFQGLSLELREEVILRSALVRAEQAGMREIGFFNRENNEFLGRVNVMIPAGDSRVIFDITLPASSDISMFINTDAGLFYDDAAVTDLDFPYALGDFGQVNSSLNSLNYYYFYDLQVEPTKKVVCVSDRVPVDLVVEFEVAVKDLSTTDAIQLFPNPSNGDLQVQYDLPTEGRLEIYNVQGQLVGQRILAPTSSERLDLTTWPRGLFWFKVYSAQDTYLAKVVLQ